MNGLIKCNGFKRLLAKRDAFAKKLLAIDRRSHSEKAQPKVYTNLEDEIRKIEPRIERRKPPIPPFLKNLFYAKVNTDIFPFPEILNKEEIEALNLHISNIENYLGDEKCTNEDFVKYLKEAHIYGAPVIARYGGLASIMTERCRMLEAISKRPEVAKEILDQWMGLDCIKKVLTEDELVEHLTPLASGEYSISTLIEEKMTSDPKVFDIACKAKFGFKDDCYVTGEKVFINRSIDNRYFVALCVVNVDSMEPFLIYPGAHGVSKEDVSVKFQNTPAKALSTHFMNKNEPTESINNFKDATINKRMGISSICLGTLKTAISQFIEVTNGKYSNGKPLYELPILQDKIASAVSSVYTLESMIYLTCGLLDGYVDPDAEVESIMCQLYAVQKSHSIACELAKSLGVEVPSDLSNNIKTIESIIMENEDADKLKLYAALSSVHHCNTEMAKEIRQFRNPYMYPLKTLKRFFSDNIKDQEMSNLNLHLEENLHLSLRDSAEALEYCLMKLKDVVNILLIRHGAETVHEHRTLVRISDLALEIYGCFCVLSRASRSYCIGIYMSEYEIQMAVFIALQTKRKVKNISEEIDLDYYLNGDASRIDIGEKAFKFKKVYNEHCLERVYF